MHGALGRGLYRKHGFYRKHRSNRLATAPKHKRAPHTRQVCEPELHQRPMVMPARTARLPGLWRNVTADCEKGKSAVVSGFSPRPAEEVTISRHSEVRR